MTAGAASINAETIRIDGPTSGVVTNEPHAPTHVSDDFRNQVFRTTSVPQSDHSKPRVKQFLIQRQRLIRWHVVGNPAAADHEDYRRTIVVRLRFKDVEGQGHPILVAIDYIRNNVDVACGLYLSRMADCQNQKKKYCVDGFAHLVC